MAHYLRMFCGPGSRGKVSEVLKGRVRESGQDVGEVVAHRDFEPAAAFDHGEDSGYARSGLFTADVDPVFSTQGYAAHGVFRQVVAKFQLGIIEEADQRFPDAQRVAAGL